MPIRNTSPLGIDALPRPFGDGGRFGVVAGDGLRGREGAGGRGTHRPGPPRDGPHPAHRAVPSHRGRSAPPRERGGNAPRRPAALPARLPPVAGRHAQAPRRRRRRLPARLRGLLRRPPHALPVVPGPALGCRHGTLRPEDRRRREVGTHPGQDGLLETDAKAAGRPSSRWSPHARAGRGEAQACPKGTCGYARPRLPRPGKRRGDRRPGRLDMESSRIRPGGRSSDGYAKDTTGLRSSCRNRRSRGSRSPGTCPQAI